MEEVASPWKGAGNRETDFYLQYGQIMLDKDVATFLELEEGHDEPAQPE